MKADAVFMSVHVNNLLIIGPNLVIYKTLKALKGGGFSLMIEGKLDNYLSCEMTLDQKAKTAFIHQPHLIAKMTKKFHDLIRGTHECKTPGTPNKHIQKTKEKKLLDKDHMRYRLGVRMLVYLLKHTQPDILNAVQELSKVLDGPSKIAWKEMKRIMKYMINTKNLALKINPQCERINKMWKMVAYSDSVWGNDCETKKSISGYILYLCGVPIRWRSKVQEVPTLSLTEAEYIALSEAAKEVKFINQVLSDMGANGVTYCDPS